MPAYAAIGVPYRRTIKHVLRFLFREHVKKVSCVRTHVKYILILAYGFISWYFCGVMARKKPKNKAASEMARARWRRTNKAQRSETMRAVSNARWDEYRRVKEAAKTAAVA